MKSKGNNKSNESKGSNTYELTKRMGKKYEINYVCPIDPYGKQLFYFQIERVSDGAILYANESQANCFLECWKRGISYNEVAIY